LQVQLIRTDRGWDDLVLPTATLEQLEEAMRSIRHGHELRREWRMPAKPGFSGLFQGPPGTGKTLAACLLGKRLGYDVYRIDLGRVESKYIGETEKNLSRVFDAAEGKRWILFFDEADALFGRRTAEEERDDRFANLEVGYLLQRIDAFGGAVILATHPRANIDAAFVRRFRAVVQFPMPDVAARRRIWGGAFPARAPLAADVDLARLAETYALSGGAIQSAANRAALLAFSREAAITHDDVEEAVRRQLLAEGRPLAESE
jgi:SpoVK/Ycf46/Vps4 family AAA+-type ATPase